MAWTKVTQRSTSIKTMTENKDKPMNEVVQLIMKAQAEAGFSPFPEAKARDHYRYLTVNKMAPGKIPEKAKPAEPKITVPAAEPKQKIFG